MSDNLNLDSVAYQRHVETINGIDLHFITAGDERHPPILLLHGFPEFWYGWRHQIPFLVNSGFRVIVPDQRGYNKTEKPKGAKNYHIDLLAADMLGLLDFLNIQKVFLVGHDWGAFVAWWLALKHPERIEKLAILNVPHPVVMRKHLLSNFNQLKKSWYIFFFQLPWLPEWGMGRKNSAGGVEMLKRSGFKNTFSEDDLEHYRQSWAHPRTWNATINWYRGLFRIIQTQFESESIKLPVHIIWGKQDVALGAEMAEDSLAYCADGELTFIERATHWVQHDARDQVNEILLNFFS